MDSKNAIIDSILCRIHTHTDTLWPWLVERVLPYTLQYTFCSAESAGIVTVKAVGTRLIGHRPCDVSRQQAYGVQQRIVQSNNRTTKLRPFSAMSDATIPLIRSRHCTTTQAAHRHSCIAMARQHHAQEPTHKIEQA